MKMMWTSEGEVQQVEVGDGVVSAGGVSWQPSRGTLHESEAQARRAQVEREASALEEQANRHDVMRVDAEVMATRHLDDAEWNRVKAAEMRARAKGLRDALAEVGS